MDQQAEVAVAKSPGQLKIEEYAARALAGESAETMLEGLPTGMRAAAEAAIAAARAAQAAPAAPAPEAGAEAPAEAEPAQAEFVASEIPPQYEGMPAWLVEEMWVDPVYVDQAKNEESKRRREAAIAAIRAREERASRREEAETVAGERASELKAELGIPGAPKLPEGNDPFSEFKVKKGETDIGAFWEQWRNREAKRLKESGQLEWGKERIYFDVPLAQMGALRDLCFAVAAREKVALAFKHIDTEKSAPHQMGDEDTRFVANFASAGEAARFYRALAADPAYAALAPDRHVDYKGLRLDALAEYASGYREGRGPLERIIRTAEPDGDGFTYERANGRRGRIDAWQMEQFQKQYAAMTEKIAEAEQAFGLRRGGGTA
jgi:hypothetical protein